MKIVHHLSILMFLLFSCKEKPPTNKFGGYPSIEKQATGHFRIQKVNERWVFITPDGHPYVALGANHIGEFFTARNQTQALYKRFKNDTAKAAEAIRSAILDMYLNAGEAYPPLWPMLKERLPYIAHIDFPNNEKWQFDAFDVNWQKALERKIAIESEGINQDSLVLGVAFADLPIWRKLRMDYYRALPNNAIGKKRYIDFVKTKYRTIEKLNRSYQTEFKSFQEIDSITGTSSELSLDDETFMGIIADTLYRHMRNSLKKNVPDKLFLGERFVLRMVPQTVLKVVGKYVDVFCTQSLILSPQRPPEWQEFQKDAYDYQYDEIGKKPMMIIDWAAPFSLDSTYVTERGTIKNELQASYQASEWLSGTFSLPYVIGVFKCQYVGSHPNDAWFPEGRMKRAYLKDDGTSFQYRTEITKKAHIQVLDQVYSSLEE